MATPPLYAYRGLPTDSDLRDLRAELTHIKSVVDLLAQSLSDYRERVGKLETALHATNNATNNASSPSLHTSPRVDRSRRRRSRSRSRSAKRRSVSPQKRTRPASVERAERAVHVKNFRILRSTGQDAAGIEAELSNLLEQYGTIDEIFVGPKDSTEKYWAKVTFVHQADAARCIAEASTTTGLHCSPHRDSRR